MKRLVQSLALAWLTLGVAAEGLYIGFSKIPEKTECCNENNSFPEENEVEVPYQYTLLPITWDTCSAELTLAAKVMIDQTLLIEAQKRKNSIIEIGAHTDSRGSAMKNQTLSEKRAKSIVKYIVSKGINENRLTAIGYGETQLKNHCLDGVDCSDSKHSLNDRIEYRFF